MRKTSDRRRSSRRALRYRGAPDAAAPQRGLGPLVVPDDQPGVVCPDCQTRVPALTSGKPRAHAPGGFGVSAKYGRYKCGSSGNIPAEREEALPRLTLEEARVQRLVTKKMVAAHIGASVHTVRTWWLHPNRPGPAAVALLGRDDHRGRQGPAVQLFRAEDVARWLPTKMTRKTQAHAKPEEAH